MSPTKNEKIKWWDFLPPRRPSVPFPSVHSPTLLLSSSFWTVWILNWERKRPVYRPLFPKKLLPAWSRDLPPSLISPFKNNILSPSLFYPYLHPNLPWTGFTATSWPVLRRNNHNPPARVLNFYRKRWACQSLLQVNHRDASAPHTLVGSSLWGTYIFVNFDPSWISTQP